MKKLIALLLALVMVLALVACGAKTEEPAAEEPAAEEPAAETPAEEPAAEEPAAESAGDVSELNVGVFYYSFADTYISSVRTALDAQWDTLGIAYQDYDGNGNQTTQNEQIQTALTTGCNLLVVNLVTSGSSDAAKTIIEMAGETPVVFFNRAVEEDGSEGSVLNAYENISFVGTDAPEAGHLQGKMIGEYVLENYDAIDLNGDGVISYAMFKGDEANV